MENYSITVFQKDSVKTRIGTLKSLDIDKLLATCRNYAKRRNLAVRISQNKDFQYIEFINRYQHRNEPPKSNIIDICLKIN